MSGFPPMDPDFESRVRANFERQAVMQSIGVSIVRLEPGIVHLAFAYDGRLTQQHDYMHAGILATVLDSACGYAAHSLMEPDWDVLSIEYKVNFLAPAIGDRFLAEGRVIRPGRTIFACTGRMIAFDGDDETVVTAMQSTIMALEPRAGR